MRILYVINSLEVGGAEKLTLDLILGMNKKFEVRVFLLKSNSSYLLDELKAANIEVFYFFKGFLKFLIVFIDYLKL
ncbi:hypothetical protein FSB73_22060 [Arachidicoccus ginsenosidivorans]|uniref:Glycosyltransferase family 4 protein n=1 Tax=Arachidicoccus ginsenosidivorans TaxID=496057 RepID=A0A5B8VRP9_9BACT|nr:hypothetical protein [Arachidicoccus ginsenosidivorans]QEC73953.1 hypothetical protein FSB73_22060 [Arachidicoccus ginsenosidivorans]